MGLRKKSCQPVTGLAPLLLRQRTSQASLRHHFPVPDYPANRLAPNTQSAHVVSETRHLRQSVSKLLASGEGPNRHGQRVARVERRDTTDKGSCRGKRMDKARLGKRRQPRHGNPPPWGDRCLLAEPSRSWCISLRPAGYYRVVKWGCSPSNKRRQKRQHPHPFPVNHIAIRHGIGVWVPGSLAFTSEMTRQPLDPHSLPKVHRKRRELHEGLP